MNKLSVLSSHHRKNGSNSYNRLLAFIQYLYIPFYNAFINIGFFFFILRDFFFTGKPNKDLGTGINRFGKPEFINSIVQQHRVLFIAIHK